MTDELFRVVEQGLAFTALRGEIYDAQRALSDIKGEVERLREENLTVHATAGRYSSENLTLRATNERLTKERDEAVASLRWLMVTIPDYLGSDGHIPRHYCDFEHYPPAGSCDFHEEWVTAAERSGLLNEWAEEDAALATPTEETP